MSARPAYGALNGRPGVYRIRVFMNRGRPLRLHRCRGVDDQGILHIGKSKDLGGRLRTFLQAARTGKAPHQAGQEFHRWEFGRFVPPERLYFDYIVTKTERPALRLERWLHVRYRTRFLDRPPLDGTSGQEDRGRGR